LALKIHLVECFMSSFQIMSMIFSALNVTLFSMNVGMQINKREK